MDNNKLRILFEGQEFEAEGPAEFIGLTLENFKSLLKGHHKRTSPVLISKPEGVHFDRGLSTETKTLFLVDPKGESVTLRLLPKLQENQVKQVGLLMLLLLLANREFLNRQEVTVLQLASSLRASGLATLTRLSNSFLFLQDEGLALKKGFGKGTTYQMTNQGIQKAQELSSSIAK